MYSICKYLFSFYLLLVCSFSSELRAEGEMQNEIYLRDNLKAAKVGDYIVTARNKNYTLLLIDEVTPITIAIEEISVPTSKISLKGFSWKNWLLQEAPGNTSWVRYVINTQTGEMKELYSYTKNGYFTIPDSENFLSTLLNIKLKKVPIQERKKVGPRPPLQANDKRPYWQPKLVFEGQVVQNIPFTAWRTFWPKDGSELSGKIIEIYLPQNLGEYPAYFPYWLQVSGIVGKAMVHIVDSGKEGIGKYNRNY